MSQTRIDFKSADAAGFNQLRDQWRSAAFSCALSRAGLRVAGVLPSFINREHGYAFPTDDDLAGAIGTRDKTTAKRGLIALEGAFLIERLTKVRRDQKGEAVGKIRRIYFTLPEVKVQNLPEVKVQEVKVHPEVKVQKRLGEGAYGCTNIPDRITLDKDLAYEKEDLLEGTYTRDAPSLADGAKEKKGQPQTEPSVLPSALASSPAPKQNSYEAAKNGGGDFAPSPQLADVPSVVAPSPKFEPSPDWRKARHPKAKQGQPLSRKPFPAPRTLDAAHAFFRHHHVPETEWARLLPDLMDGFLYEYDIEPWMDAA